jgi:hypothetical protein
MADVHKLSERVIDFAERTSAVADAAQGKKGRRRGVPTRWFLLPAAGAGLYALMTNRSFTRHLPEDLVDRVQQTTGQKSSSSSGSRPSTRKSASRTTQRRKTTSAR